MLSLTLFYRKGLPFLNKHGLFVISIYTNYFTLSVETVLTLALTAKAQDISDIYSQFKPLGIKKVVFTKLDETLTYGRIFNICIGEDKQISHVTNGQNVPDDLLTPSKCRLIDLLLIGYTDG